MKFSIPHLTRTEKELIECKSDMYNFGNCYLPWLHNNAQSRVHSFHDENSIWWKLKKIYSMMKTKLFQPSASVVCLIDQVVLLSEWPFVINPWRRFDWWFLYSCSIREVVNRQLCRFNSILKLSKNMKQWDMLNWFC